MANISAIKLPDGVTYDLVDRVSGSDIFVATYGSTTYADISSAIDAGKSIWVNNQGGYLPLVYDGRNRQDGHIFCGVIGDMGSTNMLGYGCCASNNNWSMRAFTPQEVLTSGTNIKTINNTSILGSGNISTPAKNVWYGTCSTSASIQQKAVTTLSGDFTLDEGNILLVEFASSNSYDGTATLSVDELTAEAIYVNGSPTNDHRWRAGEVVIFVYDGYHFNLIEQGMATTSYYGITKLSSSTSSTSELIAATPKAVKVAYDEATDATATPTASKKSKFDSDAHMNSTDMTAQDVSDFVDGLNVSGAGEQIQTRKLLWTNTTATASLAGQTIPLNLSEYDHVEVWFFQGGDMDALVPNPVKCKIGTSAWAILLHNLYGDGVNENTGARKVRAESTGVAFGNYVYKNRRSDGTLTTANNFLVPHYIYGIKYV